VTIHIQYLSLALSTWRSMVAICIISLCVDGKIT